MKGDIPRFLNRLLGLTIPEQQAVFNYFASVLDATIAAAKSKGNYGAPAPWRNAARDRPRRAPSDQCARS